MGAIDYFAEPLDDAWGFIVGFRLQLQGAVNSLLA